MLYFFQKFFGCICPSLESLPTLQELPQCLSLLTFWLILVLGLFPSIIDILLVLVLLLEDLLELPLLLYENALVLLHLSHALVVLLVFEAAKGLAALDAREVPRTPALALAVLVHLVLLEGRVASLTSKYHHFIIKYIRC